jgi:hypothetical protein
VPDLPDDVVEHLRSVFSACNARTTDKLVTNPNAPEESLDPTWIEHMSRYSTPVTLPSDWLVKVETHYLGGMRHFRRWEIADSTHAGVWQYRPAVASSGTLHPKARDPAPKVAPSFSEPLHQPRAGIPADTDEMYVVRHLLSHGASWRRIYLQGIDNTEIIDTVHARRAPMIPVHSSLRP